MMHFVIKLFPEITIKSAPVRKRLTKQLRDNLRRLLKPMDRAIDVQRDWEKVEVVVPEAAGDIGQAVTEVLSSTPGVANFSRVECYPLGDMDDILARTLEVWGDKLANRTFCVRVKRSGRHDFRSVDVERAIGGGLLQTTAAKGVDLGQPEVTVPLEIRGDQLFVVRETLPGLGGFPLGSQDSVLSLVSGGFDSTVASYLTMKRGLVTHFCFFNLGGRAHELAVKEISHYLWRKYGASHRVRFVTVPFEGVVAEILARVGNAYMGVVLKRMMYRAATMVAREMGVGALVTGESVAQVSSQTLANLQVIDEVTDMLTLRPLSVMDKQAIISTARAIGTETFSASIPEYCGVISVKPATRARRERVVSQEEAFDTSVLERAVQQARVEVIDQLDTGEEQHEAPAVDVFRTPQPGAVIIDIRHPDEIARKALRAGSAEVAAIPFFTLGREFPRLDQNRQYLLYCDRGLMSRLHAELLREQGYHNIAVYRPA